MNRICYISVIEIYICVLFDANESCKGEETGVALVVGDDN